MARVNSLLCYKGRTGATVTLSIASPCVLSLTAHGLVDGTAIVLTTTGALPTGLTAGTTYYARVTGVTTPLDNAHLYDTIEHALAIGSTTGIIETSGTQSGTHAVWSSYFYNLTSGQKLRWGASGSERIYATMPSWISDRSGALSVDDEYLEIVDEFSDVTSGAVDLSITYVRIPSYRVVIETKVDGVRTVAFHGGKINRGYVLTGNSLYTFYPRRSRMTIDGFRIENTSSSYYAFYTPSTFVDSLVNSIILKGGIALYSTGTLNEFTNILIHSSSYGLYLNQSSFPSSRIYNVLCIKNQYGVYYADSYNIVLGNFSNVVSYGSTGGSYANWPSSTLTQRGDGGSSHCAGASGNTAFGTNFITTVTDADFVDFANNDFRLSENSVLRDTGFTPPYSYEYDILDNFRPNFSNGTETEDKYDRGPFEYDSGNGLPPITVTVSIDNLIENSRIFIDDASNNVVLAATEVTGTSYSFEYTFTGNRTVFLNVRNRVNTTKYLPLTMQGIITENGLNFYVSQVEDIV